MKGQPNKAPTVVSVHIPKTGGTSLGRYFDHAFGKRVMYDYDPAYQNTKVKTEFESSAAASGPYLADTISVVHGHFYATKYDKVFENSWTVCCFRNPVQRIVSQFKHLYFMPAERHPDAKKIQDGDMSIVDFAGERNIGNAQTVHMDDKTVEELDFVFLTEQLDAGVAMFNKAFPSHVGSAEVPALNSNRARQTATGRADMPPLSPTERAELDLVCSDDRELYAKALERHQLQTARYL